MDAECSVRSTARKERETLKLIKGNEWTTAGAVAGRPNISALIYDGSKNVKALIVIIRFHWNVGVLLNHQKGDNETRNIIQEVVKLLLNFSHITSSGSTKVFLCCEALTFLKRVDPMLPFLELRIQVRSSLYAKKSIPHEHTFGPEVYDEKTETYSKSCTSCGCTMSFEKM